MSYRTSEDFAQETSPFRRFVYGMIRRVKVVLTEGARWQVVGRRRGGPRGDETMEVEPFTGIGFYSRPPRSGNPEAIAVGIGGTKTTALVAMRDEATRQAVAGGLEEDETMTFNSTTIVYNRKNGTVEVRTPSGVAVRLATFDDVQAQAEYLKKQFDTKTGHTHLSTTPSNPTGPAIEAIAPGTTSTVPTPVGTKVLKGE